MTADRPLCKCHDEPMHRHGPGKWQCAVKKRAYQADYNAAHREEQMAYSAVYYAAHREERRASMAAYHTAHREEKRTHDAAYRNRPDDRCNRRRAIRRLRKAIEQDRVEIQRLESILEVVGSILDEQPIHA